MPWNHRLTSIHFFIRTLSFTSSVSLPHIRLSLRKLTFQHKKQNQNDNFEHKLQHKCPSHKHMHGINCLPDRLVLIDFVPHPHIQYGIDNIEDDANQKEGNFLYQLMSTSLTIITVSFYCLRK